MDDGSFYNHWHTNCIIIGTPIDDGSFYNYWHTNCIIIGKPFVQSLAHQSMADHFMIIGTPLAQSWAHQLMTDRFTNNGTPISYWLAHRLMADHLLGRTRKTQLRSEWCESGIGSSPTLRFRLSSCLKSWMCRLRTAHLEVVQSHTDTALEALTCGCGIECTFSKRQMLMVISRMLHIHGATVPYRALCW